MTFFTYPTSFQDAQMADQGHLVLLVFEAVLEVVCVSLPGYIVARQGLFDADSQKFVANLNVMLFTPCLIFTKIASQLTSDKLAELAVIPVIFVILSSVSYLCALSVTKLLQFKKRPRNFVIAMGIFGNANSLPISLVIALSGTLKGLHWDKIPGDNDDEVAARGILYLLIFQQLGQLLRWTWGYHVLLAPPEKFKDEDQHQIAQIEEGISAYRDDPTFEEILDCEPPQNGSFNGHSVEGTAQGSAEGSDEYDSGERTPLTHQKYTSSFSSKGSSVSPQSESAVPSENLPTPTHENAMPQPNSSEHITSFPSIRSNTSREHIPDGYRGIPIRCKLFIKRTTHQVSTSISTTSTHVFRSLPPKMQSVLLMLQKGFMRFMRGLWAFMNPPLWAMLTALVVASVPFLQRLFFTEGTFIKNSVTRAVAQSGGVAIPLILVVLGANLARNTLPKDVHHSFENKKEEKKVLIAALVSRMLLPPLIMAPVLALVAKYVPVSILDDPIFVIVCFLLTGAPSALQLAQICQINGVYMGVMSRLLFQSYVVWILPSTIVLVLCALEVVEWAQDK